MKDYRSEMFKIIGIGAFLFLSVQELSYLLERILRDLHSLLISESESFLWLPELIGLVFFIFFILWAFKVGPNLVRNNTNKIFIWLMLIFFLILLLEFLYPIFGTEFMLMNYPEEFEAYFNMRKNYITQGVIGVIQILKYVVFAVLLVVKRQTVTNKASYEKP